MVQTRIKKLFHGWASVRDYIVHDAIKAGEGLCIEYDGKKMTISANDLWKGIHQFHRTQFKSKINGDQTYELIDFRWQPDPMGNEGLF